MVNWVIAEDFEDVRLLEGFLSTFRLFQVIRVVTSHSRKVMGGKFKRPRLNLARRGCEVSGPTVKALSCSSPICLVSGNDGVRIPRPHTAAAILSIALFPGLVFLCCNVQRRKRQPRFPPRLFPIHCIVRLYHRPEFSSQPPSTINGVNDDQGISAVFIPETSSQDPFPNDAAFPRGFQTSGCSTRQMYVLLLA